MSPACAIWSAYIHRRTGWPGFDAATSWGADGFLLSGVGDHRWRGR